MNVVTVAPPRRAPEAPWTPDEAASNGAVFLDEQRPGWADEVDPDTLRLESSCHCVLGQLYDGRYDRGCAVLHLDGVGERVAHLGFNTPWNVDSGFEPLTVAWRREILVRRDKP